ncbi:hypothetical protein M422DRAFT_71204 [Sphaerobolus stellatus SS14]|uniref:Uncharacterized protein n=1 Tax=Sphaerobolus stellatus (strain SS14) TaxID=990650 RepID=A0A0C9UVP9_SPHS4|nr:hypothetical protein M422DRAFT_71204 [Sphaerobolus stellatus SS14]
MHLFTEILNLVEDFLPSFSSNSSDDECEGFKADTLYPSLISQEDVIYIPSPQVSSIPGPSIFCKIPGDTRDGCHGIENGLSSRHKSGCDREKRREDDIDSALGFLDDACNTKIRKPPGEAGRPGRGGYNLQETLDWDAKNFKILKTFIHKLVERHLDTSRSYAAQSDKLIHIVRDSATEKFPKLNEYEGAWPAIDIIKMRLKYTSTRKRRVEERAALGKRVTK